jgi:hypothetical protein
MTGKINLITEPDILANDSLSVLLINLSNDDEQLITDHLSKHDLTSTINLYVQKGEQPNLFWLLNTFAFSTHVVINLDNIDPLVGTYATYFIGRAKTYFYTTSDQMSEIMSPISINKVGSVVEFFEKIGLIDHGQDS